MAGRGQLYILGNMPPPIGGVSTFMRRHVAMRRNAGEYFLVKDWVRMAPPARLGWIAKLLFDPRYLRVEHNAYETWPMLAVAFRPFPAHVFLRVHSGGPESRLNRVQKWVFRRFLKRVNEVVLVGQHVREVLGLSGFDLPVGARVEPAFLPPPMDDEPDILSTYGDDLRQFLATRSPLMVAQGSDAFYEGTDTYGADLAVGAVIALKDDFPHIGLVVGRPSPGDQQFRDYCDDLASQIESSRAEAHVAVLDGERELWPVIRQADVFLRPTISDGDSIGIREAIHFGTAVVASDVVPRPPEVTLFRSRDLEDFVRAIGSVLRSESCTKDTGAPCS